MFFEYNLQSIYATNLIGVLLLTVMFICNFWRLQYKTYENKILIYMILTAIVACFFIVISYVIEGKEGDLYRFLGYLINSFCFILNMSTALFWVLFMETHLRFEPSKKKKFLLSIPMFVGVVLLAINVFVPIVFDLDSQNWYHRKPGFYVLVIIDFSYIAYILVQYLILKVKGLVQKFFPIYIFVIPIVIGLVIESVFVGVSISWPCIAIAICGVLACLQNEIIYRDQLTGVYNRTYLRYLQKNILDKNRYHMTGIMLDIDDFKKINDKFGHRIGDIALQTMAKILQESVSDMGTVIRYAGDEFIILVHSQNKAVVQTCIDEIHKNLDEFNKVNDLKYQLSASMGYSPYNPKEQTIDDFINIIDQKMYESKKEFHHTEE